MIARLRGRQQFAAFAGTRAIRSGRISVRVAPAIRPGVPAVGFAIGRGVGPAVVRNQLRRRLRALLHVHRNSLDTAAAYLVSVHGVGNLTMGDLDNALSAILRKVAA